MDIVAVAVF